MWSESPHLIDGCLVMPQCDIKLGLYLLRQLVVVSLLQAIAWPYIDLSLKTYDIRMRKISQKIPVLNVNLRFNDLGL